MNAEQVVKKIISEAEQKAEKIRSEAQSQADRQIAEQNKALEDYRQETQRLVQKAADDTKRQAIAKARMQVNKEQLASKVAILNEVFEKARQRIRDMDDQAYKDFMSKLLEKSVETGDEEVLIGKEESRIGQDLIKDVNRRLGNGFKGNLRLSNDKADIDCGFILRRGNIRVNVSGKVLVNMVREDIETDIANELFS